MSGKGGNNEKKNAEKMLKGSTESEGR